MRSMETGVMRVLNKGTVAARLTWSLLFFL